MQAGTRNGHGNPSTSSSASPVLYTRERVGDAVVLTPRPRLYCETRADYGIAGTILTKLLGLVSDSTVEPPPAA